MFKEQTILENQKVIHEEILKVHKSLQSLAKNQVTLAEILKEIIERMDANGITKRMEMGNKNGDTSV